MKRLSIEKLETILQDYKENNITFIDEDKMIKIYEAYGDDAYYDREINRMDVVKKGRDYIKIK